MSKRRRSDSESDDSDEFEDPDISNFAQQVLQAHNVCRKRHGVPPLELDGLLSAQSQVCAKEMLTAKSTEDRETIQFPIVGENIYIMCGNGRTPLYSPSAEVPVQNWYNEKGLIDLINEPISHEGASFAQVVWKNTKLLGVGFARSPNKTIVVCQYMPPGNMYGRYLVNVLPEKCENIII